MSQLMYSNHHCIIFVLLRLERCHSCQLKLSYHLYEIVMAYKSRSNYVSNSYTHLLNMKFQLMKNIDLCSTMLLPYSITILYALTHITVVADSSNIVIESQKGYATIAHATDKIMTTHKDHKGTTSYE